MKADMISQSSKINEEIMMDAQTEQEQRQDEPTSVAQNDSRGDAESCEREVRDGANNNNIGESSKRQSGKQYSNSSHRSSSSQGGPYKHDPYRGAPPYGYPPQNSMRGRPLPPPPSSGYPPYGYAPAPAGGPHWDRGMGPPSHPLHYYPPLPHQGQPGSGVPPYGRHHGQGPPPFHAPYHPGNLAMQGRPGPTYHAPPPYPPPHGYIPYPPQPHSSYPGPHGGNMNTTKSSDSSVNSISSRCTKASKQSARSSQTNKKRSIDGYGDLKNMVNAQPFHRTGSSLSSNTAVNHRSTTSTETPYLVDDTSQKKQCSASLFDDENGLIGSNEHRRDNSVTSPASSLSDEESLQRDNSSRNLFLSLSTSPINSEVDSTPSVKNTKKTLTRKEQNVFHSFDQDPPSPTPENDMMADDHVLNQHMRNQTFTPLSHLGGQDGANENNSASPKHAFPIAPQLSWSIAGDAPSLADLASWDDQDMSKMAESRSESNLVLDVRLNILSPQSDIGHNNGGLSGTTTPLPLFFGNHPDSTKSNLKAFHFSETIKSSEAHFGEQEHTHKMFATNGGRSNNNNSSQPSSGHKSAPFRQSSWASSDYPRQRNEPSRQPNLHLPPTPVGDEHRDDICFGRSPRSNSQHRGDRDGPPNFFQANNSMIVGQGVGRGDRVRNLRGHGPAPGIHMPMPPPMSHHNLTSPMGMVSSSSIHNNNGKVPPMWGTPMTSMGHLLTHPSPHHHHYHHHPQQHGMPSNMGGDCASSKRKCVSLKAPIPSKFQGDMEKCKSAQVPEFTSLVNFPAHMSQKQTVNLPDGMRCCVMCGSACPCSTGGKCKKSSTNNGISSVGSSGSVVSKPGAKSIDGGLAPRNQNGQDMASSLQQKDKQGNISNPSSSTFAIIPTQNKGLCTLCDVNVWVVTQSGLEIKWCKGCKNFRPWAAFGDKGLATKCLRCRERQREKYAVQKEEKEKARSTSKVAIKQKA